jgi:hypothetical protein
MSDLPRPVQNRIQRLLGDEETIVAGLVTSMFYTPLVVTLGSVMALTVGVVSGLGMVRMGLLWIPLLTLVVTLYPHITSGSQPPVKAFPGGSLLLVITDERLLMYRYGILRIGSSPVFDAPRDGSVHVAASDILGPGAGLLITVPDGELRLSVWRVKHVVAYVPEANRVVG